MEEGKYLKYGHKIMLQTSYQCAQTQKIIDAYLSARSLLEENVYFIEILNQSFGIFFYDKYIECVFKILPKLRYEAVKNLRKELKEKPIIPQKIEISQKRVENETELNQLIIQKYLGQAVKLGDQVHLQHVVSKSFVKCCKSNLAKANELINIKLSDEIDSGMVFTMKTDSYFTFKKDGEKISLDDQFYFLNKKMDSQIYYIKDESSVNKNNFCSNFGINCPTIMEFNNAYRICRAGHIGSEIIAFKAIRVGNEQDQPIENEKNIQNNQIHWGDFVRMKHVLREQKQSKVTLECPINLSGFSPYAFMNKRNTKEGEEDSLNSIFQIIPLNSSLIGQPIEVDNLDKKDSEEIEFMFPNMMIRHWVTGKFISVSKRGKKDKDSQFTYSLYDSVSEFADLYKLQLIDQIQLKQQKLRSSTLRQSFRHKETLRNDSKPIISNEDFEQKLDDYLQDIQVSILSAYPGEECLTQKSCFSIKSKTINDQQQLENKKLTKVNKNCLKVKSEPLNQNQFKFHRTQNWLSPKYYIDTYISQNISSRSIYQLEVMEEKEKDTQDFFFLELVNEQEISDAITVMSKIQQLINMVNNHGILKTIVKPGDLNAQYYEMIEQSTKSLMKLCFWLCDYNEFLGTLEQLEKVPNQLKQKIIRQLGVLDLVFNILYHIDKYDVLNEIIKQKETLFYSLFVVMIEFLKVSCRKNEFNSHYVSQWYQLLKKLSFFLQLNYLLALQSELPLEIQIDQLFQYLFDNSQINYTYNKEVGLISRQIQFEKHNIQALKLLLGFCKNIQDLDIIIQKQIINDIFKVYGLNLFRKFKYNIKKQKLSIQLQENQVYHLDDQFYQQNELKFGYFMTTLQLSSEICKAQSHLIIEHISDLCPLQTCIYSFSNRKLHPQIRAIFLDLFLSSYIRFDSRYIIDRKYPKYLKRKFNLKTSDAIQKQILEQKEYFEFKYCRKIQYEGDQLISVNLKEFLMASILDLRQIEQLQLDNQDQLIISLINMLQFFLKKLLFDEFEIKKIHTILEEFIKISFTYLYKLQQLENPDQLFDLQKSITWIIKTLNVLHYIEQYQQNQVLNQFFALKTSNDLFIFNSEDFVNQQQNEKIVQNQDQKKQQIIQYMQCIEPPDTEVIYYYLKLFQFNTNEISSAVVALIFQIFSIRTNLFKSFNNIYYIHNQNCQYCDKISEYYYKLHILFVDIQNQQEESHIFIDKMDQLYQTCIEVCKNLYDKFTEDTDRKKFQAQKIFLQEKNQIQNMKTGVKSNIIQQRYVAIIDDSQKILNELLQIESDEINNGMLNMQIESKFFQSNEPNIYSSGSKMIDEESNKISQHVSNPISNNIKGDDIRISSDNTETNLITIPQLTFNRPKETSQQSGFIDQKTRHFTKILQFKHNLKIKQIMQTDQQFFWSIFDEFMIDVRNCKNRQDLLKHLNFNELIIQIITYITTIETKGDSDLKEEIIEKSLLILIFFCIQSIKNQNKIAHDQNFKVLYKILFNYQYKNMEIFRFIMLFYSQIFKDNYHLLISFKNNQEEFIDQLTLIFIQYYEKKYYEYCVHYLQILQYFFKVKSVNLIQNQIWLFSQLNKMSGFKNIFQTVLNNCLVINIEEYKLEDNKWVIPVNDEIAIFCVFLNTLQKFISSNKSSGRMLQDLRDFYTIDDIRRCLQKLDEFYFLKQEILQFLTHIYIKGKKLEERDINCTMLLLKEVILYELKKYIQNYTNIKSNNRMFVTDKYNIFNQVTSYSSTDKIIYVSVSDSADHYIQFGVLPAIDAYREKYLSKASFNEVDYLFMEAFDKQLFELKGLWQDSKNYKTQDSNRFKEDLTCFSDEPSKRKLYSQNKELVFNLLQDNIKNEIQFLKNTERANENLKAIEHSLYLKKIESIWENIKSQNSDIIESSIIDNEQIKEINMLTGLFVKMREVSVVEFKVVIQNLISLLTKDDTNYEIRKQAVIILQELANFKGNELQGKGIRYDLCELGFTDFLCQVISKETTGDDYKLMYIVTLIDFLDEGENIQISVMDYMERDEENQFLLAIKDYIKDNFNDFKEYEKGLQGSASDKIQNELREVINNKINQCIAGIWVFKMVSEGHYTKMQNYLRQQVIRGQVIKNNFNVIKFIAKIFDLYSKFITQYNTLFGEKILDFLIEVIQGPCYPNQQALCDTKILENIEDLMYDFVKDIEHLRLRHLKLAPLTKRIYLFLQSLFEGSYDKQIVQKIDDVLNPCILLKRLKFIYTYLIKMKKNQLYQLILDLEKTDQNLSDTESKFNINNDSSPKKKSSPIQQGLQLSFFQILDKREQHKISLDKIKDEYSSMIDDLKEEGEYIYILLKNMKIQSPSFKEKWKRSIQELTLLYQKSEQNEFELFEKTMMFYKLNTGRIEIMNSSQNIQILFYPKPELSKYLSESSKEYFQENVNRESANEKIANLMNKKLDFYDEMKHYQFLLTNIPIDLDKTFNIVRFVALICAFTINFLLIFDKFTAECEECMDSDPVTKPCVCSSQTPTLLGPSIDVFGFLLFGINVFSFVTWACLKLKLDLLNAFNQFKLEIHIKEKIMQTKKHQNSSLVDIPKEMREAAEYMHKLFQENVEKYIYVAQYLAFNSYFIYLCAFAFIAILGKSWDRLYYTLLLLDIIEKSMILQNVIKAITINSNQLIMTGLLGAVIMFIYSMMAYYTEVLHSTLIGQNMTAPICISPLNCFMFVLNVGLRSGGGVGDALKQPDPNITSQFLARFFFDISFFLLIIVIWMNVIFGIIIDTFASLREKKNRMDSNRRNKCFICNQERTVFEKEGIFFEKHTEKEHNLWNYFFYIVYLQEKNPIDYNGTESDIQERINQDDISWFPIGRAESLKKQIHSSQEEKAQNMLKQIDQNLTSLIIRQNKKKYQK